MIIPLLALQLLSSPPAKGPITFDTTFAVRKLARLTVRASAGSIEIHGWDRNEIHLKAVHAPSLSVHVASGGSNFTVWASSHIGRGDDVAYTLMVPRWMAMTLGHGDVEIAVSDMRGEVIAKNYSGKITVRGGRGLVSVKSILGEVAVSDAEGRITAESSDASVRVSNSKGDVDARSSSSHLYLANIDSRIVTASTVGGVISFSGRLHDDGNYSFVAHDGSVILALGDSVNASVAVSTVRGGFSSAFPYERSYGARRGQFTAKVGTGSATVEIQTFSGGVVLKRL